MTLELYKTRQHPMVTLRTSAVFYFNRPAIREFKLKEGQYCQLYYDRETEMLGFKFYDKPLEYGVRVRRYHYMLGFSCKEFLRKFQIPHDKPYPYYLEKDGDFIKGKRTEVAIRKKTGGAKRH